MKKNILVTLGCLMAMSWAGWSQPTPGTDAATPSQHPGWFTTGETPNQGGQRHHGQQGQRKRERMAKFDTNGDGKLDDSERAAARQQFMNAHKDKWAKFDTNGDGKLDDAERSALRQQMMEKHKDKWAKFDTNGDGQLDASERAAAKAAMIKKFDTDGDGKLSREERRAIMRGKRGHGRRHNQEGGNSGNAGGPLG